MNLKTAIKKNKFEGIHPILQKLFPTGLCKFANDNSIIMERPLVIQIHNQYYIVDELILSKDETNLWAKYRVIVKDEDRFGDMVDYIEYESCDLLKSTNYTLYPLSNCTGITNDTH